MVKTDFQALTDQLFTRVSVDELAAHLGCSVQSVRQARASEDTTAFRNAPDGYQEAVEKLARARAAYFLRLAERAAAASE